MARDGLVAVVPTKEEILRVLESEVQRFRGVIGLAVDSQHLEPRFGFTKHFRAEERGIEESVATAPTMSNLFLHRLEETDQDRIRVLSFGVIQFYRPVSYYVMQARRQTSLLSCDA